MAGQWWCVAGEGWRQVYSGWCAQQGWWRWRWSHHRSPSLQCSLRCYSRHHNLSVTCREIRVGVRSENALLIRVASASDHTPVPAADKPGVNVVWADGTSPHRPQLAVPPSIWRCQGGHVDWVTNGLVAWGVNHIPQRLFGILNAAAFWVAIAQENQLLLLPCPQPSDTFSVDLRGPAQKQSYLMDIY